MTLVIGVTSALLRRGEPDSGGQLTLW